MFSVFFFKCKVFVSTPLSSAFVIAIQSLALDLVSAVSLMALQSS